MLLSPEVRNAIHVGDRILEINGLPVGTMMEAEVGLSLTHRARSFLFKMQMQSPYVKSFTWNSWNCSFLHHSTLHAFLRWEWIRRHDALIHTAVTPPNSVILH